MSRFLYRRVLLAAVGIVMVLGIAALLPSEGGGYSSSAPSVEAQRRQSFDQQVSNVTCWSPGGEVALRAEGLRLGDFVIRPTHYEVYREGVLLGSFTPAMSCAMVPQSQDRGDS